MKLILFAALWLCIISDLKQFSVSCDDDVEEATVTEEDPTVKVVEAEEIIYSSPIPKGPVYFAEHFDVPDEFEAKWVRSQAKKEEVDEDIAKYDGKSKNVLVIFISFILYKLFILGKWAVEGLLKDGLKGDLGLVLKSKAKHAAISAPMDRPFAFTNKPLIVQYDVTFQNGQECGNYFILCVIFYMQRNSI